MEHDILSVIEREIPGFSKGQRLIAKYILDNYDKAAFMTAGKLGKTVFLTNEEAEAKIAEWKAKKYDPTYDPQWEGENEE